MQFHDCIRCLGGRDVDLFKIDRDYCNSCYHLLKYELSAMSLERFRESAMLRKRKQRLIPNYNMEIQDVLQMALHEMQLTGRKYKLVENYFSADQCLELYSMKSQYKVNMIRFTTGEVNRVQKTIYEFLPGRRVRKNLPLCLTGFLEKFKAFHTATQYFTVKHVYNTGPVGVQRWHCDDPKLMDANNSKRFEQYSFSMIVALEPDDNPTSVEFLNEKLLLRQGSFVLFTGNCWHRGLSYIDVNKRLFIATGTDVFMNDGEDVGLIKVPADV